MNTNTHRFLFHYFQQRQTITFFVFMSGLIAIQPVTACSPSPGSKPASIAEKVKTAPYVFEGTTTEVNPPQVTIQVTQYFKGNGPAKVKMTGFNEHSCSDFLSVGQRAIFFGEGDIKTTLSAVYDGAFGSKRPISSDTFAAITASIECMATYYDGFLQVPCIAAKGVDKIYTADLLWQKSTVPMLFSVNKVQLKKPSTEAEKPKAHVEEIEIQILESFPVQIHVVAKGFLSDGCEKINQIDTKLTYNTFTVTMTTHSVGEVCTEALVPFERVIVLEVEGLKAGIYTVDVNGVVDSFELEIDNVTP